jgi:DNA-binding NarL/FixJ family response regulator
MTDKKIRVVLADDHSIVLEGLRYILSKHNHIEVVATASTGLEVVECAERYNPDIVVMDLKMPGLDGFAAAERIISKNPVIRIIALSADIHLGAFHQGIKTGILSFVDKESAFDQIVCAIGQVMDGNDFHCTRVRSLMADNLRQMLTCPSHNSRKVDDSDRKLIEMLADGHSVGQIALAVKKSPKTIDARRRKIMQQLGLSGLAELTKYAIAEGISSPELRYG